MITPITQTPASDTATDYKGRSLGFYHPNGRGAGTALRIEPRLNRDDNDRYNCFFMELAPQKSAVIRRQNQVIPATFDWEQKITVKLGFMDIAEFLTVLEGRSPNVGGERNGLYHASGSMNTLITFQRYQDRNAYYLGASCKRDDDSKPRKLGITLSDVEATGIRSILHTGLFYVTFSSLLREPNTSRVVHRRTTAIRQEAAGGPA